MNESAVSAKRARYLLALRRHRRRVRLWQIALLVGFFAFWELSCRVGLSDGFLVSCPSRIAATFVRLCRSGDVLVHVGTSCWETALGFLLAIVLMAGVRERLESSKIPACMKGFPISLVSAGLMAIAFMGFSGLV